MTNMKGGWLSEPIPPNGMLQDFVHCNAYFLAVPVMPFSICFMYQI
jgi:hypothetical protein